MQQPEDHFFFSNNQLLKTIKLDPLAVFSIFHYLIFSLFQTFSRKIFKILAVKNLSKNFFLDCFLCSWYCCFLFIADRVVDSARGWHLLGVESLSKKNYRKSEVRQLTWGLLWERLFLGIKFETNLFASDAFLYPSFKNRLF